MVTKYKKYHRKYPDIKWNYKGISTRKSRKEIVYNTLINKGKKSRGVEIFSGRNYDVNSNTPSYSRRYSLSKVPKK